jgi:hypothetical protein
MSTNESKSDKIAPNNDKILQDKLESKLTKRINVDQLASEIEQVLKSLGKQRNTREAIARQVASALAPRLRRVSQALERLIVNRPAELAAALEASEIDDMRRFAEFLSTLPKPKQTRAKQLSEEERRKNRNASKNRYESTKRRRFSREAIGWIEQHFAINDSRVSLLHHLNQPEPTGPCLDALLNLNAVPMSGAVYCLESLFGVDRHKLPKSLPHIRSGQRILYDIRALVKCILARLESGEWLTDPDHRKLVLSGIIQRAKSFGADPMIALFLERTFHPYLT